MIGQGHIPVRLDRGRLLPAWPRPDPSELCKPVSHQSRRHTQMRPCRLMRPTDATDARLSFSSPTGATQAYKRTNCSSARTASHLCDSDLGYSLPLGDRAIAHSGRATFGCWRVVTTTAECRGALTQRHPRLSAPASCSAVFRRLTPRSTEDCDRSSHSLPSFPTAR